VIVISGPSGAGKGTLIREVVRRVPAIRTAVSATTRERRPGEVDGREYHFMSPDDFERLVAEGAFLEHAEYAGNRYGTLRGEVEHTLADGRWVILEIELVGARAIREALPDSASVFIAPPSFAELDRRLRDRGTDSGGEIDRRLEVARDELAAEDEFDHVIVNADRGSAADELEAVVKAIVGEGA
jgi:guanylate kinase